MAKKIIDENVPVVEIKNKKITITNRMNQPHEFYIKNIFVRLEPRGKEGDSKEFDCYYEEFKQHEDSIIIEEK